MDGPQAPDPGTPERGEPGRRPGPPSVAEQLWWYRDARDAGPPIRPPRLRHRRRHLLDALACLAVSVLCFSQACRETLFFADRGFYNRVPLGAPTLLALMVNLIALAAVGLL